MKEISTLDFENELKLFENLCNKALNDIKLKSESSNSNLEKAKLDKRYTSFEEFVQYVLNNTDFITAPASTKYHLCISHGLLIHSNSVAKTLLKLNKSLESNSPVYKLITCGLFHDIGKYPQYIKNEPTEKQKQYGYSATIPYSFNNGIVWFEHEVRSLYIISKFIDLDEDEYQAIMYHNEPAEHGLSYKGTFQIGKLASLLQMADMYSTLFLEERNN